MGACDAVSFAVLDELLGDEGACGVEQAIAQPPLRRRGRDQRFGEQIGDHFDRCGLAEALLEATASAASSVNGPTNTDNLRKIALSVGRQQVVAPAQRRAEGLMPRNGRPPPAPQQREAGVEQGGGAGNAIGVDTTGREFDRQRDAVQSPANFGNKGASSSLSWNSLRLSAMRSMKS